MNLKEFLQNTKRRDKHTFGEFIAQRREEIGLTQREFASKLEISNTYLWDIENGHRSAPAKLLRKMKELLNINISKENEKDFEDLLYLTSNECAPDLIQYMLASKEARQAIRLAIEKDMSGSDLLKAVENAIVEKENL
ncbi:MAG: helix-turn-helix transcriptional regulator [Clostridia bacterium]|nr:helix-turn-helix transcriptional regulator [Clostridia bacterium]